MEVATAETATAGALRSSNYVIYVDLPETTDTVLLVHGYTGAYDRVSRSVAAYVRSLEQRPVSKPLFGEWLPEEIDNASAVVPSEATIGTLKRRGYLTAKTQDEEEAYFSKHVSVIHHAQLRQMPSYVIMPTYDCNLRCHYCFQDHMRTDSKYSHLLRVMHPDMADRILAALPKVEQFHGIPLGVEIPRSFTFFGGEPLLARSRPIIERIVRGAKDMGTANFGAITNATELEAYEDLLGPEGISWLQITIDGPPEEHDKRRIHANGSGSFEQISRNVKIALERKANVIIRMNVDRSNVGNLPVVAQYFVDAGWSAYKNFSAYVAPVHDYNEIGTRGDYFNSWELGQAIASLKREHAAMSVVDPVDANLKTRALQIFTRKNDGMPERASFCGAHKGMYIFDSFGDIYACWDRTGDKNLRIGQLADDGKIELNGLHSLWRDRTVASNKTCRNCRFALYCGGGCAVMAEDVSGTMFSNHCDAFGKRFRQKVAEAFVDFARGETPSSTSSEAIQELVR